MPKMFGIWRRKMLEIPVNQAHLRALPICVPALFNVRDFVCELFTIHRFAAFAGSRNFRPIRPIGALDACAAAGRGRKARGRGRRGRGCGARQQGPGSETSY